jgi:hypothetical protein
MGNGPNKPRGPIGWSSDQFREDPFLATLACMLATMSALWFVIASILPLLID